MPFQIVFLGFYSMLCSKFLIVGRGVPLQRLSAVYSISYCKFLRNDRSRTIDRPGYVVEESDFRITIF